MWGLVIEGAILGLDFIYHRWLQGKPPAERVNAGAVSLPRTDFGGPVPLVFGWTDVKSPYLAFYDTPQSRDFIDSNGNRLYRSYSVDMMFVCGIAMGKGYTHGARTTLGAPHLQRVWYGDKLLPSSTGGLPNTSGGTYDGQYVIQQNMLGGPGAGGGLIGAYYWFGGWTDQRFDFPATPIGDAMSAKATAARGDSAMFGGLPNQMCVAFTAQGLGYDAITKADPAPTSIDVILPGTGFYFGEAPNVSAIRVEVQTYGDVVSGVTQHIFSMNNPGVDFGGDADPAEVIYDILVGGVFGKLGLDPSLIDTATFMAASATLKAEGHGYSRSFEAMTTANDMIQDVCRQIDAALGFNAKTGKLTLKLIRNDYNPPDLPVIDASNCSDLKPDLSFPSGVPNKVKVNYPDRSANYTYLPAAAQNMANAVGQDGVVVESVLQFDGIKNATIAKAVAARELAAVSRSLIKCTATCDRSLLGLNIGDPVRVNWTDPGISGIVFRVASLDAGSLTDGKLTIGLIQDAYYVYNNLPPVDLYGGALGGVISVF